jgi:lantibiotic biosynthesis protein
MMGFENRERAGTWRPLLSGELAAQAWQAILDISADLERMIAARRAAGEVTPEDEIAASWLSNGDAGLALFFAYLAEARGDEAAADLAVACLEQALDTLGRHTLMPGLFQGFSGISWVFQHLTGRLLSEEDGGELPEQIDETLLQILAAGRFADHDLINGLAGMALHALDGLPRPSARRCLERIAERLAVLAEEAPAGVTWFTPPERLTLEQREVAPRGYYNLGVSHGVPAVIAVLAAAAAAGADTARLEPLVDRAVAWLLAQEQDPALGSLFPNWLGEGIAPHRSRLAWCYGDAGIAAALLTAGRAAGRADWEREALRIARQAASRPPDAGLVLDAGLCHGAAGLGHLFNRLSQATGDEALTAAAHAWLGRALALRHPDGRGVGGFLAWAAARGGWWDDPGLLTGAAGVGLALLAAVSPVEPAWDRILLTAVPPLPERPAGAG